MARKPKAARSNDFATSPEPVATMNSDDAVGGTADADGSIADPVAAPVRKRPGPKPKGRAGAAEAAPFQEDAEAKPGRETQAPGAAPEPMSTADGKSDAGTDGQQDQQEHVRGGEPATLETTSASAAVDAASPGFGQNGAAPARPAAQWDRATDTVRFDWAEIERTASQDGPNHVMAKLLVAARAEGANSRWPL